VLMDSVRIGEGAIVHKAIIDKNVVIPPGARIGVDEKDDRFTVTAEGVTVIGKNQVIRS